MKLLLATNHLDTVGGTEAWSIAMAEAIKQIGIQSAKYWTFRKGISSEKVGQFLPEADLTQDKFDLILANHNTCVNYLREHYPQATIIQTCHGTFPDLEQPSLQADAFVSVSEEVDNHLIERGFEIKPRRIIYQPFIFSPIVAHNSFIQKLKRRCKLEKVLSLCQGKQANNQLKTLSKKLGFELTIFDKNVNPKLHITNEFSDHDLVVGIGRSVLEALLYNTPVIIYDTRDYTKGTEYGYFPNTNLITPVLQQFTDLLQGNFTGRNLPNRWEYHFEGLEAELKKYSGPITFEYDFFRNVLSNKMVITQYLHFFQTLINNKACTTN